MRPRPPPPGAPGASPPLAPGEKWPRHDGVDWVDGAVSPSTVPFTLRHPRDIVVIQSTTPPSNASIRKPQSDESELQVRPPLLVLDRLSARATRSRPHPTLS